MEMEMEASQIRKPVPALEKRERARTHKRSRVGSHSLLGLKRHDFSRKQRRQAVVKVVEDEVDEEGVGEKITALQRVVPGGEALGADELFEETAGYILELQTQVKALRALTSFFEGLQKEKTKLGG